MKCDWIYECDFGSGPQACSLQILIFLSASSLMDHVSETLECWTIKWKTPESLKEPWKATCWPGPSSTPSLGHLGSPFGTTGGEHSFRHTVPSCMNEVPSWRRDWSANDKLRRQHDTVHFLAMIEDNTHFPGQGKPKQWKPSGERSVWRSDTQRLLSSCLHYGFWDPPHLQPALSGSGTLSCASPSCVVWKVSPKMQHTVVCCSDRNCWPTLTV